MKHAVLVGGFLWLSGCGVGKALDAAKEMPGKIDQMQAQMQAMKCDLTDALAFEAMLKPEYGKDLLPVPFDLIPFAKKFAECAVPSDVPEVFFLWMKKLNEVTIDANGTPEPVNEFNHRKLQTLSALEAVAGFLPHDKLVQIIEEQVDNDGQYRDSVMNLLMLREQFIVNVLINAELLADNLTSVGRLEKAVQLADEVDFIARLPFVSQVQFKITGFVDPFPVLEQKMTGAMAKDVWQSIVDKSTRGFDDSHPILFPARYKYAMDIAQTRLSAWP